MVLTRRYLILLLCAITIAGIVGCASTQTRESTGQYLDNTVITAKVKSQLLAELGGESLHIKVKSYKSDVQLSGFVDEEKTISDAGRITRAVSGVKTVRNNIVLKPAD